MSSEGLEKVNLARKRNGRFQKRPKSACKKKIDMRKRQNGRFIPKHWPHTEKYEGMTNNRSIAQQEALASYANAEYTEKQITKREWLKLDRYYRMCDYEKIPTRMKEKAKFAFQLMQMENHENLNIHISEKDEFNVCYSVPPAKLGSTGYEVTLQVSYFNLSFDLKINVDISKLQNGLRGATIKRNTLYYWTGIRNCRFQVAQTGNIELLGAPSETQGFCLFKEFISKLNTIDPRISVQGPDSKVKLALASSCLPSRVIISAFLAAAVKLGVVNPSISEENRSRAEVRVGDTTAVVYSSGRFVLFSQSTKGLIDATKLVFQVYFLQRNRYKNMNVESPQHYDLVDEISLGKDNDCTVQPDGTSSDGFFDDMFKRQESVDVTENQWKFWKPCHQLENVDITEKELLDKFELACTNPPSFNLGQLLPFPEHLGLDSLGHYQ